MKKIYIGLGIFILFAIVVSEKLYNGDSLFESIVVGGFITVAMLVFLGMSLVRRHNDNDNK